MASRVRWLRASAGTVLSTVIASACAAISGLNGYSEGDCLGGCDASADRPALSPNLPDALPEAGTPPGDETPLDIEASASEGSAGVDATDAPSQDVSDGGLDALAEGGCGPLDTPANCSVCGMACSTGTGTPSCSGSRCRYACNSNRQDCNGASAPDTDGCECTGTACCGTGCQTIHTSGLASPANYYDCNPTGNTTQTQAIAACTGSGGAGCSGKNTTCGGIFGLGGTPTNGVCGTVASTCYCWVYSGQNAGQVRSGSGGCNVSCTSGSAWN